MQTGVETAKGNKEVKHLSVNWAHLPNTPLSFINTPTAQPMINEIFSDNYRVIRSKLSFSPGDVLIDAGANEGMFSVFMSKLFPQISIYAFEPVPETYFTLCENIKLNDCKNIVAHNLGLGKDEKINTEMIVANNFSGGSTTLCTFDPASQHKVEVGIIGFDMAMEMCGVDRVKLLKMDIEGMEYDVLYNSFFFDQKKVENFTGEVHINQRLEHRCFRMEAIISWIANRSRIIHIEMCKMAE